MIVGLQKHDKKKRLKSPCWAAGNRNEKEKKITMLGYLKSKRENYHVGLPERKEG